MDYRLSKEDQEEILKDRRFSKEEFADVADKFDLITEVFVFCPEELVDEHEYGDDMNDVDYFKLLYNVYSNASDSLKVDFWIDEIFEEEAQLHVVSPNGYLYYSCNVRYDTIGIYSSEITDDFANDIRSAFEHYYHKKMSCEIELPNGMHSREIWLDIKSIKSKEFQMYKVYGQKLSSTEYVYKKDGKETICQIHVSKQGSIQNVEANAFGLELTSEFDMENTLVCGSKRSIFIAEKKAGYLEYLGGKILRLACGEIEFDVRVSIVSYDFFKNREKVAVVHRFWAEDAPRNENSEPEGFKIEILEKLTDEQLLFILAMPILRFDFSLSEFDCIM